MQRGLVSNVWGDQLPHTSLDSLIDRAAMEGYRAIELRQGSLGEYESESLVPDVVKLQQLPAAYPEIEFNLALDLPFLSKALTRKKEPLRSGAEAAFALAGSHTPHLRLVDLKTQTEKVSQSPKVTEAVVSLANYLRSEDGILSLEHSRQNWGAFSEFYMECRKTVSGPEQLKVCFDPCNLVMNEGVKEAELVWSFLPLKTVSLYHVKQAREGTVQPVLCDGDVPWEKIFPPLLESESEFSLMLEIAPSEDIWQRLHDSWYYLRLLCDD